MIKKLQPLLVVTVGAAAAIPGMTALRGFPVPAGADTLFEFIVVVFSAVAVLTVYVLFTAGAPRPCAERKTVIAVAIGGMALVLGLFMLHVWVSNTVFVSFEWGHASQTQFVPLFLPDAVDSLIADAGSRMQLLATRGPDVLRSYKTEGGHTWTLIVLLLIHTGLVTSLASVFGFLGFQAVRQDQTSGADKAGTAPSGDQAADGEPS